MNRLFNDSILTEIKESFGLEKRTGKELAAYSKVLFGHSLGKTGNLKTPRQDHRFPGLVSNQVFLNTGQIRYRYSAR